MEKLVKVYVTGRPVVLSDSIKVFGFHGPIKMNTKDIFTCLASGAKVVELATNGEEITLNFHNYDKKNYISLVQPTVTKPVVEKPVEEVKEEAEDSADEVELEGNDTPEVEDQPQTINDEKLVTQNPVASAINQVLEQNNNSVSSSFNNNQNRQQFQGKNNKNRH